MSQLVTQGFFSKLLVTLGFGRRAAPEPRGPAVIFHSYPHQEPRTFRHEAIVTLPAFDFSASVSKEKHHVAELAFEIQTDFKCRFVKSPNIQSFIEEATVRLLFEAGLSAEDIAVCLLVQSNILRSIDELQPVLDRRGAIAAKIGNELNAIQMQISERLV